MNENSTDPRDAAMRALSVAEQLVAVGPLQEWDLIRIQHGEVSVLLHERPEDVAAQSSSHGLALTLDTNHNNEQRPYIAASGVVDGVRVCLWTLGEADEQERYTACVPVSDIVAPGVESLPTAWSAAVAS